MLLTLSGVIANLFAVAVCLAAVILGGRTERLAGALFIIAQFASLVVQSRADWGQPQLIMMAVDTLMLAIGLTMVLRTDRPWTVAFTAFQLLTVATHFAILLEPEADRPSARSWAYITGLIVWGYLIWLSLLWGTISSWRSRVAENYNR